VEVYDPNGNWKFTFGSHGSADGQFGGPFGAGTDTNGNLYVTDVTYGRVQKFDSPGNLLTKWGTLGSGAGQFGGCHDVGVGPGGKIYVLDSYYGRVEEFSSGPVPALPMSWGRVRGIWR
jgi:DNA-binding beta-propeller fold protein YncE